MKLPKDFMIRISNQAWKGRTCQRLSWYRHTISGFGNTVKVRVLAPVSREKHDKNSSSKEQSEPGSFSGEFQREMS